MSEEWHAMAFSNAMQQEPDDSEITVLRSSVGKFMSIPYQLNEDYQMYRNLRDRLMTAIDRPKILVNLKDLVPRMSQKLFRLHGHPLRLFLRRFSLSFLRFARHPSASLSPLLGVFLHSSHIAAFPPGASSSIAPRSLHSNKSGSLAVE